MFRIIVAPYDSLAHRSRMPIHLLKGINLALALLAPVLATLFFRWRALVTARRRQHSA